MEYRPAIDGLRALAVLSVMVFHLNRAWLPGGFVGVDVFFVISGYLITSIIYKECQRGTFTLRRFYQRRIARIFPAFFTVALVTLAGASWIYSPQDFASAGINLAAAALSVANLKLMFQGSYFQLSPDAQPFLHYWSLSVEEQFYIFFPLLFLWLFKFRRRHVAGVLVGLAGVSFVTSVLMTHWRPGWAFYLLPTRAWELLAGCILAVTTDPARPAPVNRLRAGLALVSLALVLLSFLVVHEGDQYPGYWALLPVAVVVALLLPVSGGLCEQWLTSPPLVWVGRISYSLYLWHWPIFSLVDYHLYLASEPARAALKLGLTGVTAVASYWLVERPAREYLNQRKNMVQAYTGMLLAILLCVPLGFAVHRANYVNAEPNDVRKGGLVFGDDTSAVTVVLMGDSNGSMYGKVLREICAAEGAKLVVISVANGDPLPAFDVQSGQLWLDSLAQVKRIKPTCLVLACSWYGKLQVHKERLAVAVAALEPLVGHLVILNQPPYLPDRATRAAMRDGSRPPFYEDSEIQRGRRESNDYLKTFISPQCSVIDVDSDFQMASGEIRFRDEAGRLLYHDWDHLSGFGAELVRSNLTAACFPPAGK